MLDLVTISAVLERLNEIKNKVNIDKEEGICYNLYNYTLANDHAESTDLGHIDGIDDWLIEKFAQWPECYGFSNGTKDIDYPVSGRDKYWEEKNQEITWSNPKRLRLLDFLIECAEQQRKEIKKILARDILNRLLEIKEGISRCDYSCIDDNLVFYIESTNDASNWLNELIELWPDINLNADGTKNINFPVDESDDLLWQNPKRLRLLDFLIEHAKKQLKE